ncbi:MAG: hypothetical protein ACHQ1H_10505 [Nitrososphaerales archaeon]
MGLSKHAVEFLFASFVLTLFFCGGSISIISDGAVATGGLPHVFTDGFANTGFHEFTSGNAYQVSLGTNHSGDLIVVILTESYENASGYYNSSRVSSIHDTANLNWHTRLNKFNAIDSGYPAMFYAYSKISLANDQITLKTSASSTQYELTAFAIHGVVSFDSSHSLPAVSLGMPSPTPKISFKTSKGGEVILAYISPDHVYTDSIAYPRNYIPITIENTGHWFYLAFKVVGPSATSLTQKWSLSPADNYGIMGDAMTRG